MFIRYCPRCSKVIKYTREVNFNKSNLLHKKCKGCSISETHEKRNIYTKEKCLEIALKYEYKKDFYTNDGYVYDRCLKKKWINDVCLHMKKLGNHYYRCVYVYEFIDKSFYVGLTYNINKRDGQHHNTGTVYEYSKINKIEIPAVKQLSDYVNKERAIELEKEYIEEYVKDGWEKINILPGGGLGNSILKHTHEKCIEIAKKCKSRKEFVNGNHGAYLSAKKNGWLIEIYNILPKIKNNRNYWTKEECLKESLKYQSKKEFRKKCVSAYNISIRKKWLNEICSHMIIDKIQKGHWSKEKCLEVSKHFEKRTDFRLKYPGAYKACRKNKWLNEFFK